MTFDGGQLVVEGDLQWKMTSGEKQPWDQTLPPEFALPQTAISVNLLPNLTKLD